MSFVSGLISVFFINIKYGIKTRIKTKSIFEVKLINLEILISQNLLYTNKSKVSSEKSIELNDSSLEALYSFNFRKIINLKEISLLSF